MEIPEEDKGWIDLGSGVWAKFFTCQHQDPDPAGALIRHGGTETDPGYARDDIVVGGISWCPECGGPTWELKSLDPLHVEPSVLHHAHGDHPEIHGFIRGGKWVPA